MSSTVMQFELPHQPHTVTHSANARILSWHLGHTWAGGGHSRPMQWRGHGPLSTVGSASMRMHCSAARSTTRLQ